MVNQIRLIFLLLLSCLFLACAHQPVEVEVDHTELLNNLREKVLLIDDLIEKQQLNRAQQQQNRLKVDNQQYEQLALQRYSLAHLAFAQENFTVSQALLDHSSVDEYISNYADASTQRIYLLQALLHETHKQYLSAVRLRIFLASMLSDDAYIDNHLKIWQLLNQLTPTEAASSVPASENTLKQWLELLQLAKAPQLSLDQQVEKIAQWLEDNNEHPAAISPPEDLLALIEAVNNRPKKIAVILPFEGKYRHHGAAIRDGIIHSWYQSSYQPELAFYSFDDSNDFINVYQEAIYDGAEMVIGPLFKNQVDELYRSDLALTVPTIALNRLDNNALELAPLNLYEYSLSSEDEIDSLIQLALSQDLHRALIIYQEEPWAEKTAQYFQDQWLAKEQSVITSTSFSSTREQSQLLQRTLQTDKSQRRAQELQWLTGLKLHSEPRARKDIDMIFVVSRPETAASLRPLLAFHYAGDIPVYASSSVYRGYPTPAIDNDLSHIYFSDAPLTLSRDDKINPQYQNTPYIRVFAMGLDSFMLAERINLLKDKPHLSLSGASGELSLEGHLVKRKTAFAQFQRGTPKRINAPKAVETTEENGD